MMNNKSQALVVQEVLVFALGIAVIVITVTIFNEAIAPQIIENSIDNNLYLIDLHLLNVFELINNLELETGSIEYTMTMPPQIVRYPYRITLEEDQICTYSYGRSECLNTYLNDLELSGSYRSGSNMRITYTSNDNKTLTIRNVL